MIVIEEEEKQRARKGAVEKNGQVRRSTEERMSKSNAYSRGDIETSNCDYVSEIFREQLSELEYSKLLAESDERDPF